MSEPVDTLEGWFVSHDFRMMDWVRWKSLSTADRDRQQHELSAWFSEWERLESVHAGSGGLFQVAGNQADLLFMELRPTFSELIEAKTRLNKSSFGAVLKPAYSYVSVVELSAYLARGNPDPKSDPYLRERLEPHLPHTDTICFYPMSKRRQGQDNWYMLDKADRAAMMRGHGMIGHRYHDRVTQIITGSQGLDDWEWGVTLLANDLIDVKKLVYEMRFDEASARFADFGPFFVGTRLGPEGLSNLLRV